MAELEAKDLEIQSSPGKLMEEYLTSRNEEYRKAGATRDMILEAMWEKIVEDRPEKAEALQLIRDEVKTKVPKPGKK